MLQAPLRVCLRWLMPTRHQERRGSSTAAVAAMASVRAPASPASAETCPAAAVIASRARAPRAEHRCNGPRGGPGDDRRFDDSSSCAELRFNETRRWLTAPISAQSGRPIPGQHNGETNKAFPAVSRQRYSVVMDPTTTPEPDGTMNSNRTEALAETSTAHYKGLEEPRISVWLLVVILAVLAAVAYLAFIIRSKSGLI